MNDFKFNNNYTEGIDDYEKLEFGDIIWAKRYDDEESMLEIPDGHKIGPYVVVNKDGENLFCLYGTSVPPKSLSYGYRILKLQDSKYSLNNITYIRLVNNCYIDRSRYIKKLSHLNKEDEISLLKKIDIVKREGMYDGMNIDVLKIPLEVGDIFKINLDRYLIIDIEENSYLCIPMLKNSYDNYDFVAMIDGEKYYLNFMNIKKISTNCLYVRENFIDNKYLKKILVEFQKRQEQFRQRFEIVRGSLVKINGINYYVYGEIGNEWIAFPVIDQNIKQLCHIVINGKYFYTNFKDNINFSKSEKGIKVIAKASEFEMESIKNSKKDYQKINKYNKIISSFCMLKETEIKSGSLVVNSLEKDILYIVIISDGDVVLVTSYNDYLEGRYILSKVYINRIVKIGDVDNFNLKQVLLDIKDMSIGYINGKRLKKIIKTFFTNI